MDPESIQHLIGGGLAIIIPVFIVLVIILPQAIRILREYERGVIFRLGKLHRRERAGRHFPHSHRGQAW